jgi:hypothetical protein
VYCYGQIWGKANFENSNGYWEKSITSQRNEVEFNYLHGILHGHGDYEGLRSNLFYTSETPNLNAKLLVSGVIFDIQSESEYFEFPLLN